MIVTITVNTTIDQILFVPSLVVNRTLRASQSLFSMGGKPTDCSWILGELGIPSLALGFAAGATGERMKAMLEARGVVTDFIPVDGETRINTVIVAEDDGSQTTITTSTLEVKEKHVVALRKRYEQVLDEATCVVMGGTMPRGMNHHFYSDLISMTKARGIPVIFDSAEPYLSEGLAAEPDFVKPNRDELADLIKEPVISIEAAYRAGRMLQERYNTSPIITLGWDGGLAMLPDRAYRVPPIQVDVVSASGAGDAVLAGLAASIHRKQTLEDGLRLGFAAANAVLLTPGTADCRKQDVEQFLPRIQLIPYP